MELFERDLPCGGGDNGGGDFENGGRKDDHGVVGPISRGGCGGVVVVQVQVFNNRCNSNSNVKRCRLQLCLRCQRRRTWI